MIYVPGEQYRRGTQRCSDPDCSRYMEVREAPTVRFSRSERIASEGLSREFAADLVSSFTRSEVGLHPYQPVRDRIIRGGSEWLPAILRGNIVPAKVLIEIANLNNPADRALLQSASFRETFARAFVDALLRYYNARAPGKSSGPKLAQHRH